MRATFVSVLLLTVPLAACGSSAVTAPAGAKGDAHSPPLAWAEPPPPPGCPDAFKVAVGSDVTMPDGTRSYFLFESLRSDVSKLPPEAAPSAAELQRGESARYSAIEQIAPEVAVSLGASTDDTPLWIYERAGGPRCKASPGDYYRIVRNEHAGTYVDIQRKLEGCSPPAMREPNAPVVVLVRSTEPLDRCTFTEHTTSAYRRPVWTTDKVPAIRSVETKGELPADIESLIPQKECREPDCHRFWSLEGIQPLAGPAIYNFLVTWVYANQPTGHAVHCGVSGEDFRSLVMRRNPKSHAVLWMEADSVFGIFSDNARARAIVTMPPDHLSAYQPRSGGLPSLIKTYEFARGTREFTVGTRTLLPTCTL